MHCFEWTASPCVNGWCPAHCGDYHNSKDELWLNNRWRSLDCWWICILTLQCLWLGHKTVLKQAIAVHNVQSKCFMLWRPCWKQEIQELQTQPIGTVPSPASPRLLPGPFGPYHYMHHHHPSRSQIGLFHPIQMLIILQQLPWHLSTLVYCCFSHIWELNIGHPGSWSCPLEVYKSFVIDFSRCSLKP